MDSTITIEDIAACAVEEGYFVGEIGSDGQALFASGWPVCNGSQL